MPASDLFTPDYARNMRLIGHSDQGGRALDGLIYSTDYNGGLYILELQT